jgi:ATP synthase protein I
MRTRRTRRVSFEAVVADRRRGEMGDGSRFGRAYQGAFEAVFSIVIGAGVGYGVDSRFATEPWGVLVGLGLGFGAFVLRLVRLGREFDEQAPPSGGSDDPRGGA